MLFSVQVPGFQVPFYAQRSAAQRVQHRTYQTRRYIDNINVTKINNMKDTHEQLMDFFEYLESIYLEETELSTHDKDMYI